MITKITIAQNINLEEYNTYIRGVTNIAEPLRRQEYARYGLSMPYFGVAQGTPQGYSRVYLMSFDVNPAFYKGVNGNVDVDSINRILAKITKSVDFHGRPWVMERIVLTQRLTQVPADIYLKLLNMGSSMCRLGMTKKYDRHSVTPNLSFESVSADFEIAVLSADTLSMKATLKKERLKSIFEARDIAKLSGSSKDFEQSCWDYYLKELAGEGDYYSYPEADTLISHSGKSRQVKDRYRAILKCVSHYKGLEGFYTHVGYADPKFSDIEQFKDIDKAKRDIRGLQALGVNPVTLSRRSAETHLPSLTSLITGWSGGDVSQGS